MGTTDRTHVTGEYYFRDTYETWQWVVVALLVVFPVTTALGAFIGGYMVVDGLETE